MNHKNQQYYLLFYLPYWVFFISGVFYFNWFADYIFFYQEKSVLFQTTFPFFCEVFFQPGGFLKYLGDLQTAFYYYPLVGAVGVMLEILIVMGLVSFIGKKISGKQVFLLPFLLGGALFFLQTHYKYWSFNTLGILFQLIFFFVVVKYFTDKRDWISVVLFPLNYFLFGSFSFLFLIMYVIWLFKNKQKHWIAKLAVTCIFFIVVFYVAREFIFYRTDESLIIFPYSPTKIGEQLKVFISVLVLFGLLPLLFSINFTISAKLERKKFPLFLNIQGLLIIIFAIPVIGRIDIKNNHFFYVEKLFYQDKYDDIIAFNSKYPSNNILTNYLNNIALAESVQLNDQFYNFPQSPDGGTLFLKWNLQAEVLKKGGYFYYTVGMINEAKRWAFEYMVIEGLTPEGLKMLIKTELISGNYIMAQKYISILKNTLFYSRKAKEYEKLLYNDEAVKLDQELGKKKALQTKKDFFVLPDEPASHLDLIIEADSTNYTALNYKLAWLLLQKDISGIVRYLPVLERCGFRKIPQNVEEAVVAYQKLNMGEMPELKYLKPSPETVMKFTQYYQIFQQNSANREMAKRALTEKFSNTFWFYVFFG